MKKLFFLCSLFLVANIAVANTDSLLQVAGGLKKTDTNLVSVYTKIAWAYLAAGDTANTLQYLGKSKALSASIVFARGEMEACNNIGMYYTKYGVIDSAINYFSQGLEKAKEINDQSAAAKSCINIASAHLGRADYPAAIQYYLEALPYLEKINDRTKIAVDYHCIGIAYFLLKNYSLSLKYYYKSLEVGEQMGKPDQSGYNYNGIGVVYKELKQYDSAAYYLNKAQADAERNKDMYLSSHNLSDIGEVYTRQGRNGQALRCLSQALPAHKLLSDQRGIAETCILLGDLYVNERDFSRAKKYFDTARKVALAVGYKDVLKNAWRGLAEVYEGLNSYRESLDAYRHYADLKDTIYTEESSRQIAEMQTKYNTEKKEKENVLLQKDNAVKNLQILKEKNQKNTLVILFAFFVLVAAIYYNRYRLVQRNKILKERELRAYAVFEAQENEKVKISKDLHDGVGAVLSLIKLNISSIRADASNEKILNSTKSLATGAIREVRGISHNLMPGVLVKAGLKPALEEMVDQVMTSGKISVQLQYRVSERLQPETERNLFRIIQEAVNNIIKHAAAENITINLAEESGKLLLGIKDDGVGFDKSLLAEISGNGLNNIFSRVDLLKGKTDIITSKGTGTAVNIVIPLKN